MNDNFAFEQVAEFSLEALRDGIGAVAGLGTGIGPCDGVHDFGRGAGGIVTHEIHKGAPLCEAPSSVKIVADAISETAISETAPACRLMA